MGLNTRVVCHDCKIQRDLDKFYGMFVKVEDRDAAIAVGENIREHHSFRAGLLCTFMWEHKGHNCSVYDDSDVEYRYAEEWDRNVWGTPPEVLDDLKEAFQELNE
jgi:hypothetical protein